MKGDTFAWRNRILSLTTVVSYLTLAHVLIADPLRRADFHYGLVITLGYGHLLGAAFFARKRFGHRLTEAMSFTPAALGAWLGLLSPGSQKTLGWLCLLAGVLVLYAGYTLLLNWSVAFALPMLAVSTWHSVENDLALESTYRSRLRPGPLPRSPEIHLATLGITAGLLAWAGASLFDPPTTAEARTTLAFRGLAAFCGSILVFRGRGAGPEWAGLLLIGASAIAPRWILTGQGGGFADLFTASVLYHLVSWGLLSLERCRRIDAPPHMGRDLAAIHLVPVALLVSTFAWPEASGQALRASFSSPFVYLFWSVAHVLQTAWLRTRPSWAPTNRRP